jgi:hypothetical protein
MSDQPSMTPTVFEVPCLECGAMPEAAWDDPDIRVSCSNERCIMSIIAVIRSGWPMARKDAEKTLKNHNWDE